MYCKSILNSILWERLDFCEVLINRILDCEYKRKDIRLYFKYVER